MIKKLKGWEMSKKFKNANVHVRHYTGVKVRCMKDHIKPSVIEKPDQTLLNVDSNDLHFDRQPDLHAKSIVDIASSIKNEEQDVTVSKIITLS